MTAPTPPIRGAFSLLEAAQIRQAIATDGARLLCPRCGRLLASNQPSGGRCSRHEVWELHCETCLRSMVVDDFVG